MPGVRLDRISNAPQSLEATHTGFMTSLTAWLRPRVWVYLKLMITSSPWLYLAILLQSLSDASALRPSSAIPLPPSALPTRKARPTYFQRSFNTDTDIAMSMHRRSLVRRDSRISNRARDECRGVKWLQVSLDGAAQVLMVSLPS